MDGKTIDFKDKKVNKKRLLQQQKAIQDKGHIY